MPCRNMNNYIIWKKSSRDSSVSGCFFGGRNSGADPGAACACGRDGELGTELSAGGAAAGGKCDDRRAWQPMMPGMRRIRRMR